MIEEGGKRRTYNKSIFIFRRDLRLEDNTGLINALYSSDSVYCFFILDSNILAAKSLYSSFSLPINAELLLKQKQKRIHLLRFLKESLIDLQKQFQKLVTKKRTSNNGNDVDLELSQKLNLLAGKPESIIKNIIYKNKEIEAIFVNRDYTPYGIKRDKSIQRLCKSQNIEFIECPDILINEPEEILNSTNNPFKVFSQYYNKAVEKPQRKENLFNIKKYKDNIANFDNKTLKDLYGVKQIDNLDKFFWEILSEQKPNNNNFEPQLLGTRNKYLELVSKLKIKIKKNSNDNKKNLLNNTSSCLSAYLKFGLCSIREVYSAIQKELGDYHPLLRQLYWRDFFVYIGFHFPYIFTYSFKEKYRDNSIKWENNSLKFDSWCKGKTGFPIVDAGMRELNETGFMHNRLRLITSSFLTKDLHIDWRYGERYFALKLIDYDPSINNGNWQWTASTGCDAQPYFRIFNPWLQQKKFDPECIYIKKWISELREFSKSTIHEWHTVDEVIDKYTNSTSVEKYPKPIIDHKKEITITKKLYDV
ncbi:MAG: deoxyribodipyrimidine photo-lyase [Nitrososphaeraceae archaeon]